MSQRTESLVQGLVFLSYQNTENAKKKFEESIEGTPIDFKRDVVFWMQINNSVIHDFSKSNSMIKSVLKSNSEILDKSYLEGFLTNRVLEAIEDGNIQNVKNLVVEFPEVPQVVPIDEIKNIVQLTQDDNDVLDFIFRHGIDFSGDTFDRLLKNNLWCCLKNSYKTDLLNVIVQAVLYRIYPLEVTHSLTGTFIPLFNYWLYDAKKIAAVRESVKNALLNLQHYSGYDKYGEIEELLVNFARSIGLILPVDSLDSKAKNVLVAANNNGDELIAFNYQTIGSSNFLFLIKATRFKDSTLSFTYGKWFQEIYVIKNGNIEKIFAEENSFCPNFFLIINSNEKPPVFYLLFTEGTSEEFTLLTCAIDTVGNISPSLNDSDTIGEYHSNSLFYSSEENSLLFNFEIENREEPNITRKVFKQKKVILNRDKCIIEDKYTDKFLELIDNNLKNQSSIQIKIADSVTIDGKSIDNPGLIKLLRRASEYYKNSIINFTLGSMPQKYQPSRSIFILENRNFMGKEEKNIEDDSGYVFLLKRSGDKLFIDRVYEFEHQILKGRVF